MASMTLPLLFDDDAPVLIFGGPYSNLQATQALRAQARQLGIPPDHVICTGDVVAYCGDPVATVTELCDWGCFVIAGNCERQLAQDAADCGCGFETGTACDLLSVKWYGHVARQLGQAERDWMAALPGMARFRHVGKEALVLHGGVTDIARFLFEATPVSEFQAELDALDALGLTRPDMILGGHCGIPFVRRIDTTEWVNAGVIGMPPNDRDRATRYVTLDRGRASIRRLDYDWRAARRAMERAGLTQGYHLALETGLWPSQDVLPESMRHS